MIEISLTQDFPAGLDRLWAAFGREDYPRQKYLALGATAVRTGCFSATAQAIEVELERDVPVDRHRLPSWARLLIGRQQTLRHRSAWRWTVVAPAAASPPMSEPRMKASYMAL